MVLRTAWKHTGVEALFKFKRQKMPSFVGSGGVWFTAGIHCLGMQCPMTLSCSSLNGFMCGPLASPSTTAPALLNPRIAQVLMQRLTERRHWEDDGKRRSRQVFKMHTAFWWSIFPMYNQSLPLGGLVGRVFSALGIQGLEVVVKSAWARWLQRSSPKNIKIGKYLWTLNFANKYIQISQKE